MTTDHESPLPSDRHHQQQQHAWLEERIVQLELFRAQVGGIWEKIRAIDDETIRLGKTVFHRAGEREKLIEQYRAACEDIGKRCPELPTPGLSTERHLDTYCATLLQELTAGGGERGERSSSTTMTERETPDPQTTHTSDQMLARWLERRIVQLSLARFELEGIQEHIGALDRHADYLEQLGQDVPRKEQQERMELIQAWQAKHEAVRIALEPTMTRPFSVPEELALSCQHLLEVRERLQLVEEGPGENRHEEKQQQQATTEEPSHQQGSAAAASLEPTRPLSDFERTFAEQLRRVKQRPGDHERGHDH